MVSDSGYTVFYKGNRPANQLLGNRLGPCIPIAYCQNIQVVARQKGAASEDSPEAPTTSIRLIPMTRVLV